MGRFLLFLFFFLSIYGSMHLYVMIKAERTFHLRKSGHMATMIFLFFLMLAPILARILESQGLVYPAIPLFWLGNLWMGLLFLFICLSLPMDAYHLALAGLQHSLKSDLTHLMLSRRQRFGLAALICLVLMGYGVVEAHRIKSEHLTLTSFKLPPSLNGIRIVQISDLHIGPMSFPARIKPVIDAVKAAQPDILVSTGDLVDGHAPVSQKIAEAMASISAPLGKFAVTGNHEHYTGIEVTGNFTSRAGFTVLHNTHVLIKDSIVIAGVDDPAGGTPGTSEPDALGDLGKRYVTILLKHRPSIHPDSRGRYDLQLSGHTHKGQIFPFNFLVSLSHNWTAGTHQVEGTGRIHVSRGSGTWGPPIRLLAPPEVTVIDLMSTDTAPSR
jgi:predicted MPP superfamily phosphohydrolase